MTIWERRPQERGYALLSDPVSQQENRYGQKIDLLDLTGLPAERSLNINQNEEVGCNPNRNKQHGFYFNADNCIGCHACEAACAEKNETPAHLAFRSVGYVEGGSYPDYQRMNISMACNHCDDPVCLKGCPTAAYTKHAEYGAVLQDPDTCFGCGYCTWVCPYNAPQLDPIEGQVSKCNMCVDRLEEGLKPACVSACVGNALDFGVIENVPEGRDQAKTSIPGFPDPAITQPNIRFQQQRKLPDQMQRTDTAPVKYYRGSDSEFAPAIDEKQGTQRRWSLGELSSRENVLVGFTLCAQAGIGLFMTLVLSGLLSSSTDTAGLSSELALGLTATSLLLVAVALFLSTAHLGKSLRFYRGFNNLRYSPVSREGLGIALFLAFGGLYFCSTVLAQPWLSEYLPQSFSSAGLSTALATTAAVTSWLAVLSGVVGLYYMVRCYLIPARPFWNHWQAGTSFAGTALSHGAAVLLLVATLAGGDVAGQFLVAAIVLGLALEGVGLICHARAMAAAEHEGGAAHYLQRTKFGFTYLSRNVLLAINLAGAIALLFVPPTVALVSLLLLSMLAVSVVGRALFYVLVIPTTMPGAFFWRNPGFESHAKEVGLASMPQVGIVEAAH